MSSSPSQSVNPHRFAVRFGNRTLPLSESMPTDFNSTSPEPPYEVLQTEAAFEKLSQHLEKQLKERVLTGDLIVNAVTLKQAVECYAAHINRIQQFCNEWSDMLARFVNFMGTASAASFQDAASNALEEEIANWRDELLRGAKASNIISETIVTAKLATKPLPDLKLELNEHVHSSLNRTKKIMLDQLVDLVDHEILGIVDWYSPEACRYHHFVRECNVELKDSRVTATLTPVSFPLYRKKQTLHASGTAKRTIWRQDTKYGIRHHVTVSRLFKNGDIWQESTRFGRDDLPLASKVLELAHEWIFFHSHEDEADEE